MRENKHLTIDRQIKRTICKKKKKRKHIMLRYTKDEDINKKTPEKRRRRRKHLKVKTKNASMMFCLSARCCFVFLLYKST